MNERTDPTPREWIGDDPFPWPPTLSHADLDDVAACFSIQSLAIGRTRTNAPFLRLQLADCYGPVEARMWDGVEPVMDTLRVGSYVGVRGRLERYQEERQLRVEQIVPLRVELDDLVLFLPRSARTPEHMDAELAAVIASVRDSAFRSLLDGLLGSGTETGHAFRLAPAAKQNHHAYLGGLLEHTLSVARVCDLLAAHYGQAIDRDLLVTGALLHDMGKVREIGARAGFPYTDEGKLLGHILIGLQMVEEAATAVEALLPGRLLLLEHLIASHQGRYEWQSPREPRTLEAVLLHYADDLDAKLNQAGALLDAVPSGWTAYDRSFGRDFLKHHDPSSAPQGAARSLAAETATGPGVGAGQAGTRPNRRRGATARDTRQQAPDQPNSSDEDRSARPETDSLDLFGGDGLG